MIGQLFARLRLGHRRKVLKEQVEAEETQLRAFRLQSQIRKVRLRDEKIRLSCLAKDLANRANSKQCGEIEKSLTALRARCDKLISAETGLRFRLEKAGASAKKSRQSAASVVPAKSFDQEMRRALEHISVEIRSFWKAKNEDIERTTLLRIEQKAAEMHDKLAEAAIVITTAVELKKQLAELPREQIAINVGTEEAFNEMNATFAQMQADADRGDYRKASQRLASVKELKAHLLRALERRRIEAREEVDMWLECSLVVQRFPELRKFPAQMTATEIEQWYSLRLRIEELVIRQAAEQREKNVPRRHRSGYQLTTDSPLRTRLLEAGDDQKLEAFLRAAKAF